jgi:hypothetical protein
LSWKFRRRRISSKGLLVDQLGLVDDETGWCAPSACVLQHVIVEELQQFHLGVGMGIQAIW